jgi:iron complex outermembrane receptor protein
MYSLVLATLLASDPASALAAEKHDFNVDTESPAAAIHEFGEQSGVQILAAGDKIDGKHFNTVSGEHSVDEGLRILLAGSGLTHRYVGNRAVALVAAQDGGGRAAPTESSGGPSNAEALNAGAANIVQLDEVVVVGSYIRGLDRPVGAEILTFDRDAIDRTGFATTQDVVRTLPQVFGGGISDELGTINITRDSQSNVNRGNSINLRGLGGTSTLILVNGRRIAPGGLQGVFTDVSNIPLSAIDRIEVLPDGASALYGSDAVGGVVNFKLRKDYKGAETQARVGSVTDGSSKELQFAQTLGTNWGKGNALLSVEYYKHDNLQAIERDLANSDLTRFGGGNFGAQTCDPGNITLAGVTYAIPNGNGTGLTPGSFTPGSQNLCNRNQYIDLLPENERKSALATVRQELGDRVAVYMDALYSVRDTEFNAANSGTLSVSPVNPFYVNPMGATTGNLIVATDFTPVYGPQRIDGKVVSSTYTLGANIDVGGQWQVGTYVSRALQNEDRSQRNPLVPTPALLAALTDRNPATALNPFGEIASSNNPATLQAILDGAYNQLRSSDLELRVASLRADGPLFALPAGDVKAAVGAEYREDSLQSYTDISPQNPVTRADLDRHVSAGYVELFVPLVSEANRFTAVDRLELTAAGRYEDYSDFGSATVPRVGLSWWPVSSFSVKGTWSKSYRAPSLVDLDDSANLSAITNIRDPLSTAPNGTSPVLQIGGANRNLQEETAKIWTGGVQFAPASIPRFTISATYFDIDFTNRIDTFGSATGALSNPFAAYAVFRNPTDAQRQAICSQSTYVFSVGGSAADCLNRPIVAIVDSRLNNTASIKTNGIDLLGNYGLDTDVGSFDFGLNATYLLEFSKASTSSAPLIDLVDTPNNPPDLRTRFSLGWRRGGFATTLYVNYTDSYKDNISQPNRKIDSWTTLDLNVRYSFDGSQSPLLRGTQVFLTGLNVLDEDPPFYNNANGVGYDPDNADLVGRQVSLFIRKEW